MKVTALVEACDVLGLSHSSYYYHSQLVEAEQLVADLEQEAGHNPTYDSKRLTGQLRRAPYYYRVNRSGSSA